MAERLSIQIKDEDNVAVAVHDLPAGTTLESGVVTREAIPQAHKIALRDIPAGGEIIRYGVVLGYAKSDIPAGSWINEHMLDLPESPALTDLPWGPNLKTPDQLPTPPRTTWMGYRNKVGPAGTRNLLGIVTTVQCVPRWITSSRAGCPASWPLAPTANSTWWKRTRWNGACASWWTRPQAGCRCTLVSGP